MPTYKQISDYIKNQRTRLNANTVEEVLALIETLKPSDDIRNDALFVFGEEIGINITIFLKNMPNLFFFKYLRDWIRR